MANIMRPFLLLCVIFFTGFEVKALPYDYSATSECLQLPQKPHYNGGLIKNPELNNGLEGWNVFGNAKIEQRESLGNKYVVAYNRNQPSDTVSLKINLQKGLHYTLSGWIQVTGSNVLVKATLKTNIGHTLAGSTYAESNCWSMFKGGFTADTSGPAELYFESKDTSVDILIDNVSLQPFTEEEWKSHHVQSIEKARKRNALLKIAYKHGSPVGNVAISIKQKRSGFPFGSAINRNILSNTAYQNWFSSRFTVTTFENELKWYSNEAVQGRENYADADSMLQFAKRHNIHVRGHCVLWDDPKYQPSWVPSLSSDQLNSAVRKRIASVVKRYKDQLIAWDVVNENLHSSFFESKLGQKFSSQAFSVVQKIDPSVTLFLNEYNTIEEQTNSQVNADKYIQKIREIQSYPASKGIKIGVGLESHFSHAPNLPYMRASIDKLASTGSPIWITELDVANQPKQVEYFEQVLREAHSHPKVQGIVMWTTWSPNGQCYRMCLVDQNFKNLPGGNVVDKLLGEWGSKPVSGITNQNGTYEVNLFHGDYEVTISDPANKDYQFTQQVQVLPADQPEETTTQVIEISI